MAVLETISDFYSSGFADGSLVASGAFVSALAATSAIAAYSFAFLAASSASFSIKIN